MTTLPPQEASVVMIYATWPSAETAEACAKGLVERGLAACVTVLPGATSVFSWDGAVQTASETVMLAKTRSERAAAVRAAILLAHPYDLPCVLSVPADRQGASPEFLAWVAQETAPEPP